MVLGISWEGVQQPHLLSASIGGPLAPSSSASPGRGGPRGRRRHTLLLLPHPPRLPPSVCLPAPSPVPDLNVL